MSISEAYDNMEFKSFNLDHDQLIKFKNSLEKELEKLNNNSEGENKDSSSQRFLSSYLKNPISKIFHQLKPKNSFERTRNHLTLVSYNLCQKLKKEPLKNQCKGAFQSS